jgi:hypothetical protein
MHYLNLWRIAMWQYFDTPHVIYLNVKKNISKKMEKTHGIF